MPMSSYIHGFGIGAVKKLLMHSHCAVSENRNGWCSWVWCLCNKCPMDTSGSTSELYKVCIYSSWCAMSSESMWLLCRRHVFGSHAKQCQFVVAWFGDQVNSVPLWLLDVLGLLVTRWSRPIAGQVWKARLAEGLFGGQFMQVLFGGYMHVECLFSGYVWSAHLVARCEMPVQETWLLDYTKEGYVVFHTAFFGIWNQACVL